MSTDAATAVASICFLAPLPPPALRRNSETVVKGYRAALVRQYQEDVWCAGWDVLSAGVQTDCFDGRRKLRVRYNRAGGWLPWPRAALTLTWRHHRQGPDEDNALASLKPLIDVLHCRSARPLSIVIDDSPEHLSVSIATEKVRTKAEEGVLVTITRVA